MLSEKSPILKITPVRVCADGGEIIKIGLVRQPLFRGFLFCLLLHLLLQIVILLFQLQGIEFPIVIFTYEVLCEKGQMKRDDIMSSLFFNYPLGGNGSLP